jgi:hypothetical protein
MNAAVLPVKFVTVRATRSAAALACILTRCRFIGFKWTDPAGLSKAPRRRTLAVRG